MRPRTVVAVLGASALVSLVVLPVAQAGQTETTRYKGSFRGEPGTVSVEVKSKNDRPRIAIFEAKRFELLCDDGSIISVPSITLRARFGRQGRFWGDYWEIPSLGGGSEYYEVDGRLGKRNIRGNLLVLLDRRDTAPDCTSFGNRGPWLARRVGS